MIGNGAGALVATGTERTARSPTGRMHLADRLPDGFTDADLDAATREAAMAPFAKSWRRESGQCPLSGVKRTLLGERVVSAYDPKRTKAGLKSRSAALLPCAILWSEAREALALKRREFITLLGGAAASWPFSTRAQQLPLAVVGFVDAGSADGSARFVTAFRKGLNETGYVEGQNVTVE